MPIDRSKRLNVRVTPEEIEMLATLADAMGMSSSDVVRQLVRQAYADTVAKKKKR